MADPSFLCTDPEATRALGACLGELLRGGDVLCLSGPLGAGKTCFVQGLAEGLGVDPAVPVTSPTFTLVGEYPGRIPLRHADFYRVDHEARLFDAGFEDLFDDRGAVVVEWGERWPASLPDDRLEVRIEIQPDGARRISLASRGERSQRVLAALESPRE